MSSVKVAVRVRPLNKVEVDNNANIVVRMKGEIVEVVQCAQGGPHKATFDHAFWSCNTFVPGNQNDNAPQEVVYTTIGTPMLQNTFDGYNSCLFAYGQTGSGKTYTVMGNPTDEGIAPRMGQDIFQRVKAAEKESKEVAIEVSFLEIYNEKVRDLLNPDPKGFEGKKLRVREHPKHGTFVEGLSQFVVTNPRDLHEMVVVGNRMRTTGATQMNLESSRSHAILTVRVTQTNKSGALVTTRRSLMNLVDLAGSERADKTGATGARLAEGSNINRSLTTLGMVISQLSEGKDKHIPYRDSMLTWILKDTLGGNSMTTMLATISPASYNYEETISTLRYAECAKKIKNKAVINESNNSEVIAALQREIAELRLKLLSAAPEDKQELADEVAASEQMQTNFTKSISEKKAETKELLAEREKNIEELRARLDAQDGELSNLRLANKAKDKKIQELLARLTSIADSDASAEAIREQIAQLEIEAVSGSTPNASPAKKTKKSVDIDATDDNSENVRPAAAAAATAAAAPSVLDNAIVTGGGDGDDADMDDIDLDDVDLDGDDDDVPPPEDDDDLDDIDIDDLDDMDLDDEDIDIDDLDGLEDEAAADDGEKEPPKRVVEVTKPSQDAAIVKDEDLRKDEEPAAPSPTAQQSQQPAAAATAPAVLPPSTNIPIIKIKSSDLPNNRYLVEPFRVIKIDEEALISSRKERVWNIDFFNRKFSNMDLAGYESFFQPAANLYRVEKHPHNTTRLTLYFFEAQHPYDLQFTSTERRQRFYELAMLLRRNSTLWCPTLVPSTETDANVNVIANSIQRPNGKVQRVKGDVTFSVARMPYEVIDLWYGCMSLQNKPLPRSATVLASFMPRAVHEVYIIGLTDVPASYMGTTEIGDYFVSFLGTSLFFVLSSTAAMPHTSKRELNNVFVVICRRSFIVRMSHLEAHDINSTRKDGSGADVTAVGCSLRINEASIGCMLINTQNRGGAVDASARAAAVRGLMASFPFGDTSVDIGVRFDYFIVSGALGFGGDYTSEDMLLKQMKAGNVMSDMTEEQAPTTITSRQNPMRIFYAVRPRSCRMDPRSYTSTRALESSNVSANFDVFCQRAFLSTFGSKVLQTKLQFNNFLLGGQRIPFVNNPELQITADWLEGGPVSFRLKSSEESTYFATGAEIPVLMPVVHNPDFLRLQHLDFTLYGVLPTARDKKKIVIASGSLSLKNVATLGATVEFTVPLYYRGCNVGTLQSDILHFYSQSIPADLESAGVVGTERNTHIVACCETQALTSAGQWVPTTLGTDGAHDWAAVGDLTKPQIREDFELPDGKWQWLTGWRHDVTKNDPEGWGYGLVPQNAVEAKKKKDHKYRRRRWLRVMKAPGPMELHSFLLAMHDSEIAAKLQK